MKKIAVLLVSAMFLLTLVGFGQTSTSFKVDSGKFEEEYSTTAKTDVNAKVINNFNKMFANARNVSWTKDKRVDRVYFERDGKTTRAAFNQKGQLLYSITTYGEEFLPQDILMMVKNYYYGKQIFGVTEVSALGKTAYLLILEDKTSWLHIKVLDGDMTEEKVLLKAK